MTKTAIFFPGQGSQSVGMMNGFEGIAIIKETFKEASDLLGVDFWKMVTEENTDLNQTENTQPLMLAAGVATWRVYQIMKGATPELWRDIVLANIRLLWLLMQFPLLMLFR